jgi:ribosomal protein S18 acetylase RimI-like enzyme
MSMSRLILDPYDKRRDHEVQILFKEYTHKDHQLRTLGIPKERMAVYLEKTLDEPGSHNICLRDNGRLVGLISLQFLPWMSEHFGLRMCAVRHLLARSDSPMVHTRLLRFVMEELKEVDFLDCRVAVDDIYSAHALEVCGFRYVGTEIFLGQVLNPQPPPCDLPSGIEICPCRPEDRPEILDIVGETHVHNRFVYDPIIQEDTTRSLYRKLVANCFEAVSFRVLVARSERGVEGFLTFKMNPNFSQVSGIQCGSLDFIGVRPQTRTRGLGAALNRMALREMVQEGDKIAAVRTLASNYPALKTCFRTGFMITSTSLHFHRWIHRPKIAASVSTSGSGNNLQFMERVGVQ